MNKTEKLSSGLFSTNINPPRLPAIIKYVDDFTDETHSIVDLDETCWRVWSDGAANTCNFAPYGVDPALLLVIKGWVADAMMRGAPSSAVTIFRALAYVPVDKVALFLEVNLDQVRAMWDQLRASTLNRAGYTALKSLLRFSARSHIGSWNPLYQSFISTSLPEPSYDKFATVRAGDVFISVEEEAKIVRWIYENAVRAASLSSQDLIDTAMIVCCYQFAMRPKQIGMLRRRDCRVLRDEANKGHSVHLTFKMIKQKTKTSADIPLIRRVKREWATLFAELFQRGADRSGDDFLLGYESAYKVSARIGEPLSEILHTQRSATDLRHSGAIRHVDAGASAEELAEYMGHSSLETGLVYFDTSSTQAERVNQALGISETYVRLAKLGKERFISTADLSALKGEHQIAGVPHGTPIAGIGGCQTGQPLCPYNPITACYGCPKFLPVNEVEIHKKVLGDFREVVKFFYEASRGESTSPAYLQLQRTIAEVAAVIDELENSNEQ